MFNILDVFCGAGGLSYGIDKNKHFHTKVALAFDVMVLVISIIAFCLAVSSLIISVKRKDDNK